MKPQKQRKGFAAIPRERVREIASLGGKASHAKGRAHEYTHAEAVAAGRKGGRVSRGGRGRDWKSPAKTA
jgi:general stress protein YciG